MDEARLRNIIQQEINNYRTTFEAPSVTPHIHNKVDSPGIQSSDLYPYQINQPINYFTPTLQGSITLFDYSNIPDPVDDSTEYYWGSNIFLGFDNDGDGVKQSWSELNLADFYLDASQTTPQTILPGGNDIIVFDVMNFQKPYGAYNDFVNPIDGTFKVVNGLNGQPSKYTSNTVPIWYMVTASVGIAPTAAVAGEYCDIEIWVDGTLIHWNRQYFPTAVDPIVVPISVLMSTPILQDVAIKIYNGSANNVDTNIAGMEEITYFKIKQLK